MLHAQTLQHLGDQLIARAVEGGVDHLEVVRHLLHYSLVGDLGHDAGKESLVGLLAHEDDLAGGESFVIIDGLIAGEHVQFAHLLCHLVGVLRGQLCAILPVDLIAVVLLGVMAGGDVDTGDAAILTDGEGHHGGGTHGGKQTHGDTVGSENAGGLAGKELGIIAAVVAHGHATLHSLLALLQDHLGEGLSSVTDYMDVHAVQAHAHNAPQTCRTEGQLIEETTLDLLVVIGNGCQLCLLRLAQRVAM